MKFIREAELRAELDDWKRCAHGRALSISDLQQENKQLRDALEIYADKRHWKAINSARETTFHPDIMGGSDRFGPKHGYEIAQQALAGKGRGTKP
jgi:hypothetical protein